MLGGCSATPNGAVVPIQAAALSKDGAVIGKLGIPLGKIVMIEGDVTEELYPGTKGAAPSIRVFAVDGRALREQVDLPFGWLFKRDKPAIKGRIKYPAYETGKFIGVPAGYYDYVGAVQTSGYFFMTELILLDPEETKILIITDEVEKKLRP